MKISGIQMVGSKITLSFYTVECEHTIVKGKGHELGKGYVGSVIDKWLLS